MKNDLETSQSVVGITSYSEMVFRFDSNLQNKNTGETVDNINTAIYFSVSL